MKVAMPPFSICWIVFISPFGVLSANLEPAIRRAVGKKTVIVDTDGGVFHQNVINPGDRSKHGSLVKLVAIDADGQAVDVQPKSSPPSENPTATARHLDREEVLSLERILEKATALEGSLQGSEDALPNSSKSASGVFEDIEYDVAHEKDPTNDVGPEGKDHDAVLRAIEEVSAGVSVEEASKHGELVTIEMLEAISGLADTPEDATTEGNEIAFEGDMMFSNATEASLMEAAVRKGGKWTGELWPDANLAFCFGNTSSSSRTCSYWNPCSKTRQAVQRAVEHIEEHSCVRFNEADSGADKCTSTGLWVINPDSKSCSSYVGIHENIHGGGIMKLHDDGCLSTGTVIHEFLHALGMSHEHSRPDRDDFVTVLWDNIKDGKTHNFDPRNKADVGVAYDYNSLMHYGRGTFGGGKDTLDAKGHTIGQREGMSETDVNQLRRMYCNGAHEQCSRNTGHSCRHFACGGGARCTGYDKHGPFAGGYRCICEGRTCAVDGVCVAHSQRNDRRRRSRRRFFGGFR